MSNRKFYPERVSASVIGRKWICDEASRLRALGLWRRTEEKPLSRAIRDGAKLDKWLKQRPKSWDEKRLREKLDKLTRSPSPLVEKMAVPMEAKLPEGGYAGACLWKDFIGYGAMRFYEETGVIAHWDDFRTYWNRRSGKKVVWHVEYKGLTGRNWIRFEAPAAQCQVTVTQWVWQPIWLKLGWKVADKMEAEFYLLKGSRFLERQEYVWSEELALDELDNAFDLYSGRREPIAPKSFKCKYCSLREICTILKRKGENT